MFPAVFVKEAVAEGKAVWVFVFVVSLIAQCVYPGLSFPADWGFGFSF